jgi:hypothetical protein
MKLNKNILQTILLGGLLIGLSLLSQEEVGNRFLLPEDFKVYAGNHGVVNHPVQGLTEKTLTTRNLFQKTPGCYIACYSRDPEKEFILLGMESSSWDRFESKANTTSEFANRSIRKQRHQRRTKIQRSM